MKSTHRYLVIRVCRQDLDGSLSAVDILMFSCHQTPACNLNVTPIGSMDQCACFLLCHTYVAMNLGRLCHHMISGCQQAAQHSAGSSAFAANNHIAICALCMHHALQRFDACTGMSAA